MRILATLVIVAGGLFAAYWYMLRPVLKQRAEFADLYAKLDELEAPLMDRVRLTFKGLKTWLINMAVVICGVIAAVLPMIEGGDLSWLPSLKIGPLTLTPQTYGPLLFSALGAINLYLRTITTTELGEPVPPEIALEVRTEKDPGALSTPAPAPPLTPKVETAIELVVAEKQNGHTEATA